MVLKRGGNEVLAASSVAEALDILNDHAVDLITCDLMMPEQSGLDFLRIAKGNAALKNIPVVVVSAAGYKSELDEARHLGAAEVVTKPFSPSDLSQAVAKYLAG
jgi:CheY-like chemotaxis protein